MPLRCLDRLSFIPDRMNHTQQTITAFVDLLGLGSALRATNDIGSHVTDEQQARPLISRSHGTILRFRHEIEDAFRAFGSVAEPPGLTRDARSLWTRSHSGETRPCWFSDCGLFNVLIDRTNPLGSCREVLSLFIGLSFCTLQMATHGQLIREGIDTGLALVSDSNEVLGSGLVAAHELESQLAVYPRIVLGRSAMGFLRGCTTEEQLDALKCDAPTRAMIRATIDFTLSFVTVDQDGLPRLHFTTPEMLRRLSDAGHSGIIARARTAIKDRLEVANKSNNVRIISKYLWMHNTLTLAG
jgi:hypothetical protein